MTAQQRVEALEWLAQRAKAADKAGLKHTAKSWRDYADGLAKRHARDVVCCKELGEAIA